MPASPLPLPFSREESSRLSAVLLQWFEKNQRPLPWRVRYDPYEIWIAEMMLQQTQMVRGTEYFVRWMKRFPSVADVAAASEEEVLHCWEGLGYYRRAGLVHEAAQAIVRDFNGRLPCTREELLRLPGVGGYTAAAIAAIACQQDEIVIDANVMRIFSRLFDMEADPSQKDSRLFIENAALSMLPSGKARSFNQAIMELGEVICLKKPLCSQCPAAFCCRSLAAGTVSQRPVSAARPSMLPVAAAHAIVFCSGSVLLCRRPSSGLWANMWEFPGCPRSGTSPDQDLTAFFAALGLDIRSLRPAGSISHTYTHHRLTAHFYIAEADPGSAAALCSKAPSFRLAATRELFSLPMPAHHRKMAQRCVLQPMLPLS